MDTRNPMHYPRLGAAAKAMVFVPVAAIALLAAKPIVDTLKPEPPTFNLRIRAPERLGSLRNGIRVMLFSLENELDTQRKLEYSIGNLFSIAKMRADGVEEAFREEERLGFPPEFIRVREKNLALIGGLTRGYHEWKAQSQMVISELVDSTFQLGSLLNDFEFYVGAGIEIPSADIFAALSYLDRCNLILDKSVSVYKASEHLKLSVNRFVDSPPYILDRPE